MQKTSFNEALLGFLDASPTPYHATANMAGMLENAGFEKLDERDEWSLECGKKYYVIRNDASVIEQDQQLPATIPDRIRGRISGNENYVQHRLLYRSWSKRTIDNDRGYGIRRGSIAGAGHSNGR